MKLREYPDNVSVINSVLPLAVCDGIVEHFKHSENLEEVDNEGKPTFTQLNLNVHHGDMIKPLTKYVMKVYTEYRKSNPTLQKFLPTNFLMEEFRVKRYNALSDEDLTHILMLVGKSLYLDSCHSYSTSMMTLQVDKLIS